MRTGKVSVEAELFALLKRLEACMYSCLAFYILLEQYISESNETESEININDCADIKEYVNSGRADRMKKTSKLA